jgi:hypothetical protein
MADVVKVFLDPKNYKTRTAEVYRLTLPEDAPILNWTAIFTVEPERTKRSKSRMSHALKYYAIKIKGEINEKYLSGDNYLRYEHRCAEHRIQGNGFRAERFKNVPEPFSFGI